MALTFAAIAMEGGLMVGKAVGAAGLHGVRGIIHSPICVHLCLHNMVWPQYMIAHLIFMKVMVHPALHIVTMDKIKCEARPGMM